MDAAIASGEQLLLFGMLGERRLALPVPAIDHVLPMAALTPLAGAPEGVVGVLAVRGEVLSVVDPRPRLGLPTPAPHPSQFLVQIAAPHRFMLWLDRVEGVEPVQQRDIQWLAGDDDGAPTPAVARLARGVVPIIAPAAFAPRRDAAPERGG